MRHLSIELSEKTWGALHALAELTETEDGPEDEEDRLVHLVEESLRTFEWMVYRQLQGKYLAVLTSDDLKMLGEGPTEGEREVVEQLFPVEKSGQVAAYFDKAA